MYAHERIGIKELSTADLHISNDTGEIFMSTVDDNTLISLSVDSTTKKATLRGEHKLPTNSYFQLSAQNPATLELGSGSNKLTQSADGTGIKYRIESSATQWQELKNDSTTNHYTSHFGDSEYSVDVYSEKSHRKHPE